MSRSLERKSTVVRSARVKIETFGDQGILATFPSEEAAARFAQSLREAPPCWLVDVVLAHATVAVFHDPGQTTPQQVAQELTRLRPGPPLAAGPLHEIPCCYERQLDLHDVARRLKLTTDEVIQRHVETTYVVFAVGYCPGFPYLGNLPQALQGVPRRDTPRTRVAPGSVGLAASHTGIYPLPRPGGWSLIGQTPLELVNLRDEYFPLRAGDRVRFRRIDESEFNQLLGERLPPRRG
jgi:inhibitor of KinA